MGRPFPAVLRDMNAGQTLEELTDALAHLVGQVTTTHCTGVLTLSLKVKPNGDHSVIITPEIKVKEPVARRADSVFFVQGSGELMRNDPRQTEMNLPKAVTTHDGKQLEKDGTNG